MDFPFRCWNCDELHSKLKITGLCWDCERVKTCRKCKEVCRGIDKRAGLCWSCAPAPRPEKERRETQ